MNKIVEDLDKQIDVDKEIIALLPKNEIKELKNLISKISEVKEGYDNLKDTIYKEICKRYNKYLEVNENPEIKVLEQKIIELNKKINLVNTESAYEKLGLDKLEYNMNGYYKKSLTELNSELIEFIKKYKNIGIEIEAKDFDISEYCQEYMIELLKSMDNSNSTNIERTFETIYWKCPELLSHIYVNIRTIYDKHKNKIEKYFKDKKDELEQRYNFTENTLENQKSELIKEKERLENIDGSIIINKFLNSELSINDYKKDNYINLYKDLILKDFEKLEENDKKELDENFAKLNRNLNEYFKYLQQKYLVDEILKIRSEELEIDTPDWTNKTKMQETYDQFVWVPVKNAILDLSSTYSGLNDAGIRSKVQEQINVGKYPMAIKTNAAGDYIGVLYEFSEVTENNTTYVKVTPESLWNPKSTILREPAGLKDSTYGDTVTYLKQINGILNTSYNTPTSFESALQSQYNEMVKKVEEKGGFWVGRYETSSMSNSTTENYIASNRIQVSSKRNTTNGLVGVTWYKMYAQQKIYSELALESKTTSSMIWGSQYDQIMIWMKEEKSSDQAPSRGKYYVTNGAGKGNYGTISGVKNDVYSGYSGIAPTGSQDPYSTKNIFDLAGNVYEWSLEACNTYYRTRRGGYFLDTNAYATRPDDRNSYCPTDSISYDGSRLTLY